MTNTKSPERLAAAIDWLQKKDQANRYALEYMASTAALDAEKADHLLEILNAVVSGELVAVSETPSDDHQSSLVSVVEAQPVAWRTEDRTHPGWYYYGDASEEPMPEDAQPLYAHPAPERCYEVKEGYEVDAFNLTRSPKFGKHFRSECVPLSEAITLRSVEDVRREVFMEAAQVADVKPLKGGRPANSQYHAGQRSGREEAARLIRQLVEKEK